MLAALSFCGHSQEHLSASRSPYTVSASCHIEQRHYKSLWQSPFLCRQQDCAYRSGIHTQQHHDGSDVESSAVTRSRRTAAARS
ncbi:uncharacterized protein [Procambarus clarkii]|uniref:uncharacterized protein isoform X3 n=1 Tax=Procambarus clarkii TaxID=6728 RepID=UPI00374419FF